VSVKLGQDQATAIKPDKRYQTVLEMLNALSEINEWLDWQYTEGADYQLWEHDTDERKTIIYLKKLANSKFNIVTSKTIKASGNTTNVSKGCVNGMEESKIEDFIIGLLEEYG
jgi:eukaryotic-like serine/threonine-protein kinase